MGGTTDYVDIMLAWSRIAERSGMRHEQVAVLAAQFVGTVLSNAGLSADGQRRALQLCTRAMATACANRVLKAAS